MKKLFKNRWVKWGSRIILGLLILFFGFYASIYFGLWGKIPSVKELAQLNQSQATQVLDKDEVLIGKFYTYDRESIAYNDFPQHLIDALIATEDVRFYEHDGVDNKSLLRVFFKTILLSDESSGGGSTITLQLAKNLYGRNDYGYLSIVVNKVRESIVAKRIEEIYSKKEILTLYLNTVPFSDNTYGIESAANKFFNSPTSELNLPEAATLIGSLKANHSYNPRLFPERSQLRRDVVLQQMTKYGYISEASSRQAMQSKIELDYQDYATSDGSAAYFKQQIKRQLEKVLEEKSIKKADGSSYNINTDGLKVYTTLDHQLQQYAEEAMKEHMQKLQAAFENAYGKNAPWLDEKLQISLAKKLKKQGLKEEQIIDSLKIAKKTEVFNWEGNRVENISTLDSLAHYLKFLNSGLLALEPQSGAVRAYIGGIDYRYFNYDHVLQSKRQVGSTFKPIVYTAALENGMDPCEHFSIKAVTYTDEKNWTPTNASDKYDEDLNYSIEFALSRSINTIAVKVLQETGINNVISQAQKMGIESEIKEVPSIALGSAELHLAELAKAYTSFVNNSSPSTPFFITKIEDKNGKTLAEFSPEKSTEKAFSNETRDLMVEIMQSTVNEGTAKRLRSTYNLRNDIAGKTGTTQDNKDGWFVGVTPKLVTVVWVGNDDHRIGFSSTGLGQGANSALPIFAKMMQKMNANKNFNSITQAKFDEPSDDILKMLDCDTAKKDGFFKRLFGGKEKKEKKFEEEEKDGGFFSFLKGKKDDKEKD